MKRLVINLDRCNGCYNCQIACKDEHVANDWSPVAKPQPNTGHFWLKVSDIVQGTVPKVRVRYMVTVCQHCENAPCLAACTSGAIYWRPDGIVIIDPEKCTGCRNCQGACPYGVIYYNTDLNISQKCTMCAHLLDDGWQEPRCVDACPTGALRFAEESELKELVDKSEVLHPEHGTSPNVRYLGLPDKLFIAGAVYDPEADECLEDVTVTLAGNGQTLTATTDIFGDFWFERQEPGSYSLQFAKDGYAPGSLELPGVKACTNIGDVELHRK